jgi:transposase
MAAVAWNPLEFHVLEALLKGRTFHAEYCHDGILTALVSSRSPGGGKELVTHMDNARAHTAQKCIDLCAENGLRFATHPPY